MTGTWEQSVKGFLLRSSSGCKLGMHVVWKKKETVSVFFSSRRQQELGNTNFASKQKRTWRFGWTSLVRAWEKGRCWFFVLHKEKATFTVYMMSGLREHPSMWTKSMSKQSPDQSPPLGLDARKSGARLCADWLRAKRSAPAFPSQQEVHTRWCHGIEDVSCGGDDQFCVERRRKWNYHVELDDGFHHGLQPQAHLYLFLQAEAGSTHVWTPVWGPDCAFLRQSWSQWGSCHCS